MMRKSSGFTLVEVALFLAVTGLLFVGVTVGVQNSVLQQRYTDAVQTFAEFLRSAYSQTMNVENATTGGGRTEQAIYGRLLTFGESYDLAGNPTGEEQAIFAYTVIGTLGDIESGGALESLKKLNVNVVVRSGSTYVPAGISEQFLLRWGARIQTTAGYGVGGYMPFKGAVLVVRHPRSGTVHTFSMTGETIEVNEAVKNANDAMSTNIPNPLLAELDNFQSGVDVDFCVSPSSDDRRVGVRRDIRIIANARNASGVETVGQDAKGEKGNRCE